ncbi:MAG: hypothetical protein NXI31_05720 [bacterium]|nr:hypothetical protein [bacterium]
MTDPHRSDGPDGGSPGDGQEELPPDPRLVTAAGGCLYFLLLLAGLVWLWWRDRLELLPELAIGERGLAAALVGGVVVALLGLAIFSILLRRLQVAGELAAQARRMFLPMGDLSVVLLVLIGAVAEEVFFRLAVQDQFGLAGSVAAYGVMSMCGLGVRWLPFALLHALALGGLVASGFGLLASAAANAVTNYLCLRRMLVP